MRDSRPSSDCTSDCQCCIILRFLNFISKCFIIWLIIHNITIVKVWPYKRLINCNKSLSWKFIGEVSEEPNAFINLAKLLFYVSIVIEFFIKIQPNMFLNGSLRDWYIIEIYGRMILFRTLPWKNHFLCFFWGIWIKKHFPCIGPFTNFIKIIVKLWCWTILILNNWKE